MSTTVKSEQKEKVAHTSNKELATFIGELFSFNSSLKLFHWSVTGTGSYAKHMALDEAIASLLDVIDRITETTYAMVGDMQISIPETKTPKDIVKHATDFYNYVENTEICSLKHSLNLSLMIIRKLSSSCFTD